LPESVETYILELGRGELSHGLELMRRLLDRGSKSAPHVTVRYSTLAAPDSQRRRYGNVRINDLVLAEPMTFDDVGSQGKLSTLAFRCESTDLEAQIYKPFFWETVSHCTVYDGPPSKLAHQARQVLSEFEWDLLFPAGLRIRPYVRSARPRQLSRGAAELADRVWPWSGGSLHAIDDLDRDDRLTALRVLCSHLCSEVPRRPGPGTSAELAQAGASALPSDASQPALFDFARSLQVKPLSATTRALHRRQGTVVTPPEVAGPVVHHLNALRGPTDDPIKFGDPAIGGGVFFAHAARLAANIESATGVEINPVRAAATAFAHRRTPLRVLTADFLALRPELGSWNFITANPPYLRSQDLPEMTGELRAQLERSLDLSISGRADLYMYFLLSTHAWMAPDALAAWLIPSEFMVTKAGRTLRRYLSEKVELLQVHVFGDDSRSLFQDVLVASCVVFLRNRPPRTEHRARFTTGPEINRPRSSFFRSMQVLRSRETWNIDALRDDKRPTSGLIALGDLFNVRRGIATGANRIFVVAPERSALLGLTEQTSKPILTRAHLLPSDGIILSDADGAPLTEGLAWLIDSNLSFEELRRVAPQLAEYLGANRELALQSALVRRRTPFYKQDAQDAPSFIFTYMSKRKSLPGNDRFFSNYSQARVLNNFLILDPRPQLREALESDGSITVDVLESLRSISQDELSRHGRSYASGLLKLEPSDLRAVELVNKGWM
jgi:hypothetical protein